MTYVSGRNTAITSDRTPAKDCARIKELGYSTTHHIKLYGQHFEIVSDPFPEGGGVAVHAITSSDSAERTVRLPVAILVGLRGMIKKAA
jgi:hypothetical protein